MQDRRIIRVRGREEGERREVEKRGRGEGEERRGGGEERDRM
jgi:hypothetical protein